MCNIYCYNQSEEKEDVYFVDEIFELIRTRKNTKEITLIKVFENRRSSRELLKIIKESNSNDYMLFNSVKNLILNDIDFKKSLELLISKGNIVIFKDSNVPIEKQIQKEFNKTFLLGVYYSILKLPPKNNNFINKPSLGRPLIQYPDNWEENYMLWKNKKIPSKEFLNRVGLKKATFYNLLTEYRKSEK